MKALHYRRATPGNWQARLDSNQGLRESKSRAFDQLGDAPMMMVAERDGFEPTSFRLKGGHPKPLDERSNWRGLGGSNTYLLGGNQARTPVRQARIDDGGEFWSRSTWLSPPTV